MLHSGPGPESINSMQYSECTQNWLTWKSTFGSYSSDTFPSIFVFQLEESEFTCAAAVKARKSMEVEIEDLHIQMEDISKTKQAVSTSPSQPLKAAFLTRFLDNLTTGGRFDEVHD